MEKSRHAIPGEWPVFWVYCYLVITVLVAFMFFLILTGSSKLGGIYFLTLGGMVPQNACLGAFLFTFFKGKREWRFPTANARIGVFCSLCFISNILIALAVSLHVFTHGKASGLQPFERMGDRGTTYYFAAFTIFALSFRMIFNTIEMVFAYCEDIFRPSTILVEGQSVKIIKED
jgi:hypothetical protein